MNSLYIMSKQSKVVDVSVCSSCRGGLDLRAEGEEKKMRLKRNYLRPQGARGSISFA